MLQEYGPEPLRITNHDLLFQQLNYTRILPDTNLAKLQRSINSQIKIYLNSKMARRIEQHGHQLGYHLYLYHRRRMMNWADAQTTAGISAMCALYTFLASNGVEEEDFSLETAYRYWSRHKARKKRIESLRLDRKASCEFRSLRNMNCTVRDLSIPLPEKQVEELTEFFLIAYSDRVRQIPKTLPKQVRMYLYYEKGKRDVSWISERTGHPPRTCYYHIGRMRQLITSSYLIRTCLEETLAMQRA